MQHIYNFDVMNLGVMPSKAAKGTTLRVTKRLEACKWEHNDSEVIEPGEYKVVSRKSFRGGSLGIERIGN